MKLVIVESPTKSKTISHYLGPNYKVLSSYGHVRDLPKGEIGIDIENNFQPKYVIPLKARKNLNILKKESQKAQLVLLAMDEDREGEAIAWHIVQILDLDEHKTQNEKRKTKIIKRIVFHEITKQAIEEALKSPRDININLVDAQQARRILDRLVGYKLSPFLWKKVARGLSAGRVQSVAVRLVMEREKEIQNFVPQKYWSIEALLKKIPNSKFKIPNSPPHLLKIEKDFQKKSNFLTLTQGQKVGGQEFQTEFKILLVKKDDKVIPKLGIKTKEEADKIVKDLKNAEYKVINIEKKEVRRNPLPPFTTSSLQQEAWQRFKWPAKLTMLIAQQLYETGKITYHRTDSLNLSDLSLFAAKKFIVNQYGKDYWPGFLRKYKTKTKGAQEAHEAIRPTYPDRTPEKLKDFTPTSNFGVGARAKLDDRQYRLYDLIWRRFISSQMSQASFNSTIVEVETRNPKSQIPNSKFQIPKYTFRTSGQILKFDGFLKVYPIKYEEVELPPLKINEILELIKLISLQHFTQPPARYNEATLIKELEKNGIGRPSTYAPILSTIQERNYIEKDENRKFRPTEIGTVVNDILVNHFPKIVDIGFTAKMEKDLDKIAEGKIKWRPVIKEFYDPFEENLQKKYQEVSKKDIAEKPTEKTCPKCKAQLLIKLGKFGKFYACSKFPKCKYTESLEENKLKVVCPKCGSLLTEKRTKKRKIFYGCSSWPKCDFALWDKPTGEKCQKCSSLLVETKRKQIKCSSKDCDFELKKE